MLTVVLSEWCSYGWGRFVLTFLHFSKLLPAHKPLKLEKKNLFFLKPYLLCHSLSLLFTSLKSAHLK